MKINWIVRIKNKTFWFAMIPAILLLIQTVSSAFGFNIELDGLENNMLAIINSVFTILTVMGVITDPTTDGISDSAQAMTYMTPKKTQMTNLDDTSDTNNNIDDIDTTMSLEGDC